MPLKWGRVTSLSGAWWDVGASREGGGAAHAQPLLRPSGGCELANRVRRDRGGDRSPSVPGILPSVPHGDGAFSRKAAVRPVSGLFPVAEGTERCLDVEVGTFPGVGLAVEPVPRRTRGGQEGLGAGSRSACRVLGEPGGPAALNIAVSSSVRLALPPGDLYRLSPAPPLPDLRHLPVTRGTSP